MRLELTTSAVTGRRSNQLSHWAILKVFTFKTTRNISISEIGNEWKPQWPTPRPISTGQLHALPHFHLRPINLVVFKGSYHLRVGYLISGGASRLDAFSVYPFRTWLPGYDLGRSTGAPAVRPSRSSRTKDSSLQVSCAHAG